MGTLAIKNQASSINRTLESRRGELNSLLHENPPRNSLWKTRISRGFLSLRRQQIYCVHTLLIKFSPRNDFVHHEPYIPHLPKVMGLKYYTACYGTSYRTLAARRYGIPYVTWAHRGASPGIERRGDEWRITFLLPRIQSTEQEYLRMFTGRKGTAQSNQMPRKPRKIER